MKTITLSISKFVSIALRDEHYINIYDKDLADLLTLLAKDQETYHIQHPSLDCPDLEYPRLWNLHQWRISVESWRVARERSERERVERWIQQKNCSIISKHILRFALVNESQANLLAYRWLKRKDFDRIKWVGVTKLITKESEL